MSEADLERLTKLSEAALARRFAVGSTSSTTRRDNDARGVLLAALRAWSALPRPPRSVGRDYQDAFTRAPRLKVTIGKNRPTDGARLPNGPSPRGASAGVAVP